MCARSRRRRSGFTLVELMVVAVIIAILTALLLPVIAGAVRTTRNTAVTAEFQTLSASLEAFRNKYGEYPPSRIMLCEDGRWNTADATMVPVQNGADITYGALATRSIAAIRKFWPDVPLSTTRRLFDGTGTTYFDFNGNSRFDAPATAGRGYILDGSECLAFFLGGISLNTASSGDPELSLSGFATGKVNYGTYPGTTPPEPISPRLLPNPFRNNLANSNIAYWGDRDKPFYEFRANRLVDADNDGFPEYTDSLATSKPIAYFRADGQGFDPNDVNVPEPATAGTPPVAVRKFRVAFPVVVVTAVGNTARDAVSPGPNPYTTSAANTGTTTAWHKSSSFQLISPGADGLFGLGGQYAEAKTPKLNPEVGKANTNDQNESLRAVEKDNLTNFASGMLD